MRRRRIIDRRLSICRSPLLLLFSNARYHFIADPVALVGQKSSGFEPSHGQSEPGAILAVDVRGQNACLQKDTSLIPPYVLVVEAVAADIDNRNHGHGELCVGGVHVGQKPGYVCGVRAGKYELICGKVSRC